MVILAHTDIPNTLLNIMTFDVILLVFISGMSLSFEKSNKSYPMYLWKRVKKLLIPTYIVITICLVIKFFITGGMVGKSTIIQSYTLVGGIGYVWIVRIYLMLALVSPFFKIYSR